MKILNYDYTNKHKNAWIFFHLKSELSRAPVFSMYIMQLLQQYQSFCGDERENEYSTIVLIKLMLLWNLFLLFGLFFEMQIFKKQRNQVMTVNLFL